MRTTIDEISRQSGVSRGTVDRALNNRKGVSEKTKARIMKIAEDMNYRPDVLAQGLALGRSFTIGMVTLNLRNSYIAEIASYTEQLGRNRGYFTYITNTDSDPDIEVDCIKHLIDRRVDGLILLSIHTTKDYYNWLMDLKIPIITLGNRISPNIPFVGINDREAAFSATSFIHKKGYDRIVLVCPPLRKATTENIDAQEQRYFGYLDFFNQNDDPKIESIVIRSRDAETILDVARSSGDKRTAFFCTNDIFALQVYNILKADGIKVPRDVGIMGFDNIEFLKYTTPKLYTIDQGAKEISSLAIDRLISLINKETIPAQSELPFTIIEGETL
jgi:LacI family transcriptional regulator